MANDLRDLSASLWQHPATLNARDPWIWTPPLAALLVLAAIYFAGINQSLFLVLNKINVIGGDWFWQQVTVLGDAMIVLALLALWLRYPRFIWAACIAAVLASLWTHGIKGPWPLPRPAAILPPEAMHVIGKVYRAGSFPSGHSTTIFTLAGMVSLWLPRSKWRWLPLLLAVPVALSRCVVGAHWPIDLLGGLFGGWVAAATGLYLGQRGDWGMRQPGRLILAAPILLAALLMPFFDLGYPAARPLQAVLGVALLVIGARTLYRERRARPAPHAI